MAKSIQTRKRDVPIEQILAVQGRSPVASGIETLGNVLGQALTRKAELQRQGQQLAKLESLTGQTPGTFAGLDPSTATSFANKLITDRSNNYNPQQLAALMGGDPTQMSSVFPQGVPKEAAGLAVTNRGKSESRENLQADREARRDERLGGAAINYWKTLETNPVIKTLKQQDIGLYQVDALAPLIDSGNTVASNALGMKMARGMGEVGVLTDTDVVKYVQSGQLTRGAADKLSRMIRGVPTDATLDELREITKVLRDSYQNKIQPLYNDAVDRFAVNYDLTPEEASKRLVIPYTRSKKGGLRSIEPKAPQAIIPPGAMTATNPTTKETVFSTDGGQTWQPAK